MNKEILKFILLVVTVCVCVFHLTEECVVHAPNRLYIRLVQPSFLVHKIYNVLRETMMIKKSMQTFKCRLPDSSHPLKLIAILDSNILKHLVFSCGVQVLWCLFGFIHQLLVARTVKSRVAEKLEEER